MRAFIANLGLVVGAAGAATIPLACADPEPAAPASRIALAQAPFDVPAADEAYGDPYAPLWQCREEVRQLLSITTDGRSQRPKALADCIAAAERGARMEIAGEN